MAFDIETRPHPWRRTPWIRGTRLPAGELIRVGLANGWGDELLAMHFGLAPDAVAEARRYVETHRAEVGRELGDPRAEVRIRLPYHRPRCRLARSDTRLIHATDAQVAAVRDAARTACGDTGDLPTACHDVAAALSLAFRGATMEGGRYAGPMARGAWGSSLGPHSWVRTDEGGIVDAAAEQFGHGLLRIPPRDRRLAWYERGAPLVDDDGRWIAMTYLRLR